MHKFTAFTLAEVTAVLVLLGVVIAITVPGAINNANTKSRQLKVKKAASVYQQAIEYMIIENDIPREKSYFNNWAISDNCTPIRQYFKVVSTIGDDGCKFLSANDIFWDFKTFGATKPIIAFNKNYFTKDIAESEENTAFIMSVNFSNDGGIRINDIGFEKNNGTKDDYWNVSKIDCFINNKTCKKSDFIEN